MLRKERVCFGGSTFFLSSFLLHRFFSILFISFFFPFQLTLSPVFFISQIALCVEMILLLTGDLDHTMKWLGIICAFRLLKLFATFPQFQHIIETFTSLVPCVLPFLAVLFCFYYIWAIVGMLSYYGKLVPTNPKLKGTDYDTLNYYCNNFDNYPNALVTLFELMVVNNWQVCGESACEKVIDVREEKEIEDGKRSG